MSNENNTRAILWKNLDRHVEGWNSLPSTKGKDWKGVAWIVDPSDRIRSQEDYPEEFLDSASDSKTEPPARLSLLRLDACDLPLNESFARCLLLEILIHLRAKNLNADFDDFLDLEEPWSSSSTYRFGQWLKKSSRFKPSIDALQGLLVLIEGADAIAAGAPRNQAVASARAVCRDVGVLCIIFVAKSARLEGGGDFVLNQLSIEELEIRAAEALRKELHPNSDKNGGAEGNTKIDRGSMDGFWGQLKSRMGELFKKSPEVAGISGRVGPQKLQGSAAVLVRLIAFASYPSAVALNTIVTRIIEGLNLIEPDQDISESSPGQDAVPQLVFFRCLECAFPQVLDAAKHQAAGYEGLHVMLRSFAEPASLEESVVLNASPWKEFSSNERLCAFLQNALHRLPGQDGSIVRLPESSVGLQEHVRGLIGSVHEAQGRKETNLWNDTLTSIEGIVTEILDEIAGCSSDSQHKAIQARNSLRNVIREVWSYDVPRDSNGVHDLTALTRAANEYLGSRGAKPASGRLDEVRTKLREVCDEWTNEWKKKSVLPRRLSSEKRNLWISQLRCFLIQSGIRGPEDWKTLGSDVKIQLLALSAICQSREGAARFEALCWTVRAQLLLHKIESNASDKTDPSSMRADPPSLSDLEVDVESSFRLLRSLVNGSKERELVLDLLKVQRLEYAEKWAEGEALCESIKAKANEAGLPELVGRASFQIERFRVLRSANRDALFLHVAQGMLRLEDAWSPFFSASRKHLFISYSRHIYDPASRLACALGRPDDNTKSYPVWFDNERITDGLTDFRAEMQIGLDRADAVLLLLSRSYFESRWCSYELSTALARQRMNQQHLAWAFVDEGEVPLALDVDKGVVEQAKTCAAHYVRSDSEHEFMKTQLEALFIQKPLVDRALQASGGSSMNDWRELKVSVKKWLDRLASDKRVSS